MTVLGSEVPRLLGGRVGNAQRWADKQRRDKAKELTEKYPGVVDVPPDPYEGKSIMEMGADRRAYDLAMGNT
jgi:hypothetical protein